MSRTQFTVTNDFEAWCKEDANLIDMKVRKLPQNINWRECSRSLARYPDLTASNRAILVASHSPTSTSGWARFSSIRAVYFHWGNGDKIYFPLNCKDTIYLGNDHRIWTRYWPFMQDLGPELLIRQTISPRGSSDSGLLIGGQSHFGHFIYNRLLGLKQVLTDFPELLSLSPVYVPPDYTSLHYDILESVGFRRHSFMATPRNSCIMQFCDTVIPAIDPSIKGLANATLCSPVHTQPTRKYLYITRSLDQRTNDRIDEYLDFCKELKGHGFDILSIMNYTHAERASIISDYDFILTDPGSCIYNAYIYRHPSSKVIQMMPKTVLSSPMTEETYSQIYLELLEACNGSWLPLETCSGNQQHSSNGWHSRNIPPDISTTLRLLHSIT